MDAREVASALFRILETGDPTLATEVVAADNRNREASVAPPACAIPGPAGTLASSAWMRSAFSDLRFPILGLADGDGQVAGHEALRDDMTMLAQLGVFPPAAATAVHLVEWRVSGRASRAAEEVAAKAAAAAQQLARPTAPNG